MLENEIEIPESMKEENETFFEGSQMQGGALTAPLVQFPDKTNCKQPHNTNQNASGN